MAGSGPGDRAGKGRSQDWGETWGELMPEWRLDRGSAGRSGQTRPREKGPGPREQDSFEKCK